jgi:hypothetical protein
MTEEERLFSSELERVKALRAEVSTAIITKAGRWARGTKPQAPELPPVPRPLGCALLSVDPGINCGWALFLNGNLDSHGHCMANTSAGLDGVRAVCSSVTMAARDLCLPLVAVISQPSARGVSLQRKGFPKTIERARRAWVNFLIHNGCERRAILGILPTERMAAIFGSARMPADQANRATIKMAREIVGTPTKLTEDECCAIVQGAWGMTSPLVAMMIREDQRYLAPPPVA